jgi:hypothetical protein
MRAAPLLVPTEYFTVPLPLPLALEVIVIQAALVAAVHVQPLPAVTLIVPMAPAAVTA